MSSFEMDEVAEAVQSDEFLVKQKVRYCSALYGWDVFHSEKLTEKCLSKRVSV